MFGVVSVLAAGTLPAQERRMENEKTFQQMFPQGEPLPEQFSKYFTGQAWLARLTTDAALNVPVSNVTFSPGCRNNWHSHTGGQLLIAVGGRGYYQEKGRPGSCCRATWWRSLPTWCTGTGRLPTAGSPIWPSSATLRPM